MFYISLSLLMMFMHPYYFECMVTPYFCVGCLYLCVVQILRTKDFTGCNSWRMAWSLTHQLFITIGSLFCVNVLILEFSWGFFLFSNFILGFSLLVKTMWLCFELISAALFLIKLKYFLNDENVWHPVCLNINCIFNLENTN